MMKKNSQFGKPEGFFGRFLLRGMNVGHGPLARWALAQLNLRDDARILDVGCGGGATISRLLSLYPRGIVDGVDYSEASVSLSRKKNVKALGTRCSIVHGDVLHLPFKDGLYDAVTAFETVYFWPDLALAFSEVRRILKPGGIFLIACEMADTTATKWSERIEGLTIYSGGDLQNRLERAGFSVVKLVEKPSSEWVCLVAGK
ncbi:MAG: methyltransferase domain-containing protein [Sphaerochaetaceae bacterium]|nr:methyltransferase domain-containing protein [Sphaerochaetaceae bacterium]